jgi:hypothetical protein
MIVTLNRCITFLQILHEAFMEDKTEFSPADMCVYKWSKNKLKEVSLKACSSS